jgi:hypothetical protein
LPAQTVVVGAIFDIKDPVRRAAFGGRKDSAAVAIGIKTCSRALVSPIRFQHEGGAIDPRRATDVEGGVVNTKGQVAVRSHGGTVEILAIEVNGERQADRGIAVVGMVTRVVYSRHKGISAHGKVIDACRAVGAAGRCPKL